MRTYVGEIRFKTGDKARIVRKACLTAPCGNSCVGKIFTISTITAGGQVAMKGLRCIFTDQYLEHYKTQI